MAGIDILIVTVPMIGMAVSIGILVVAMARMPELPKREEEE